MRFDDGWIERESEQGSKVGEREKAVGDGAGLKARQPNLEQRAGCAQHEKREADGKAERGEDGRDGMLGSMGQADCLPGPGDGRGGCQQEQGEMQNPAGAPREPVRVEVGGQQGGLKEDQAGDPDGGRSAEDGQELLGGDGLDQEEEERSEKDGDAEEET